jgi:hypothetical protein
MSAFNKQEKLRNLIEQKYSEKNKKPERDFAISLYEIGDKLDLTIQEIGNLCELVYKILSGDQTIGSLETAVLEILDESNRENMGAISAFITTEIIDRIKYDLYGQKNNLVSNPHESIKPATPTYQDVQDEENPNISETIYEKISREQILRDLENPPPAKFSSSAEQQKPQEEIKKEEKPKIEPKNEVTDKDTREVPIMHTMSRDITKKSGGELPKITAPSIKSELPFIGGLPRGKFGTGSVPQVRQMTFTSNSSFERKNEDVKNDIQIKKEVPIPKSEAPKNLPTGEISNIPPQPVQKSF